MIKIPNNSAQLAQMAKKCAARVYRASSQSIINDSLVSLVFDNELFDTDSIHDNLTNNTRLTCKTTGTYLIIGQVQFATNATGVRGLYLHLNDASYIAQKIIQAVNGEKTKIDITTIYALNEGDYITLKVYQNSGGALNAEAVSRYSPEFMMVKVG